MWLDPDKMAALNLSAMDVVTAVSQQNVQVAAGQIGQPPTTRAQQFQLTINTLGRLTDAEQFADIIVKTGGQAAAPTTTAPAGMNGASASSGSSDAGGSKGSTEQATGIVRLRDVVRENKYYVRIRLDADRLAKRIAIRE